MTHTAKTIVHVNQHIIRRNHKLGEREPALTIKHRGKTTRAFEARILGPSRLVYRPDKPLSCGARCWLETWGEVEYE